MARYGRRVRRTGPHLHAPRLRADHVRRVAQLLHQVPAHEPAFAHRTARIHYRSSIHASLPVFYDPNQQVNPAVAWLPDGNGGGQFVEYNGGVPPEHQLAVAEKRALVAVTQAAMPSDQAIVDTARQMKHSHGRRFELSQGDAARCGGTAGAEATCRRVGRQPTRAKMPAQLPENVSAPAPLTVSDMSLTQAVRTSNRDQLVFGYSPSGNDLATWDVTETPMMRIHGGTQKGKTSAALAIVAAALAQTNQVVIIDNRGFKNWHVAAEWAELVDARTTAGAGDHVGQGARRVRAARADPSAEPGRRHRRTEGQRQAAKVACHRRRIRRTKGAGQGVWLPRRA